MKSSSLIVCSLLPTAAMALVSHQYWSGRSTTMASRFNTKTASDPHHHNGDHHLSMYFDDCERSKDVTEGLQKSIYESLFPQNAAAPWIISRSDEKHEALERFLGFNPKTVSKLTDEQIEEETLRWVVNTEIIASSEDDDDDDPRNRQHLASVQYESIHDLLVASSRDSTLECMTFLWNTIAQELEEKTSASVKSSPNSVKLIVFPNAKSLWDYDTMVTMLEAIQIAKPLLPSDLEVQLDLFHPDFKHSPRMWSPQWHSPFPTVGIRVKKKQQESIDDVDVDTVRSKLDILFQSIDATREDSQPHVQDEDPTQIIQECQSWLQASSEDEAAATTDESDFDWTVQTLGSPFQLYKSVWNSALALSSNGAKASVVVDPVLDSRTLYRVAVTVNAALMKLDIPVRITQVHHPYAAAGSSSQSKPQQQRPPYGMIQLSPVPK